MISGTETALGHPSGGYLGWGGENFSLSAEDINFSVEGDDLVPILRVSLRNSDGELENPDVNLSERISNNDGSFYFD
ncbi:CVNH domain-containing protein [Parachaetomium inaequale]|uniref:CVNH domain-containing protein n=1 Tax=Parachaetomium inaequale TaxID=2588326 RepID=A0AAN6PCG8_9PEZI|nr:CVNH domain-containing protein [Parachaetomium inaequale]